MSYAERHTISITTDASGDATAYSPRVTGVVRTVQYVKTDFAAGVDFTITSEATGQGIWTESDVNASATRAPQQPTHGQDGTASLYAGSGEPVETDIALSDDRVKFVIANGGNAKTGTFYLVMV